MEWQGGGIGGVAAPAGAGGMGGGQMPQQVNAVPPGAPQMPAVAKNSRIFCNNLAWTVGGDELKTYFLNNGLRVTRQDQAVTC
jgi:hypothetical protein